MKSNKRHIAELRKNPENRNDKFVQKISKSINNFKLF